DGTHEAIQRRQLWQADRPSLVRPNTYCLMPIPNTQFLMADSPIASGSGGTTVHPSDSRTARLLPAHVNASASVSNVLVSTTAPPRTISTSMPYGISRTRHSTSVESRRNFHKVVG